MKLSTELLRADRIGIRDFREHMSMKKLKAILIVTDHGVPVSVNLPYDEMLELLDVLDEIEDKNTLKAVAKGRHDIRSGLKSVLVKNLFNKICSKKR